MGTSFEHLLAESDRALYLEALAVGTGTPGANFGQTVELTGVRKNGDRFPIELSLSTGPTADTSVTAVIRDATERKRNEDALREREAELRQAQKMEAIGLLAGGVAHDFNNLLMAIHGYSELVLMSLDPDHECRADIDEILKASNRAAALTRQLLAFSRRQVLAPQVLSLDEVLAGTEKLLRRLIAEDVEISSTIGPDLGSVRADPGQIEQVLINLAVNARDAMPGGGRLNFALANVHLDDSHGARSRGDARPLRPARGQRHGLRHATRGRVPHLRTLLHDEGGRPRHGPRSVNGLRHCSAKRRINSRRKPRRTWDHVPDRPAVLRR